jgi:hypothetical protein
VPSPLRREKGKLPVPLAISFGRLADRDRQLRMSLVMSNGMSGREKEIWRAPDMD